MKNNENGCFVFYNICGVGVRRHFSENNHFLRFSKKKKIVATVIFFIFSLFLILLIFSAWTNAPLYAGISSLKSTIITLTNGNKPPLLWDQENPIKTCGRRNYPTSHTPNSLNKSSTCPVYFQWIYEDLKPWKHTGITKDMVKAAMKSAHFKLVIVDGKAYVERLKKSIQTRDMFSIWGILQLLRYYPGTLPDLELYFDCGDRPVVEAKNFLRKNSGPPPVFRYCSDPLSLDIVFPDWSFWGWAECNIKPWGNVLEEIKEGNKKTKWENREPYAYWRGNPYVAPTRQDLLRCNVSDQHDWNTRLYIQNWDDEIRQGFKQSSLGDQCTHRYKIYTEGWAWSVSEKYILACDSMTLYIRSQYHDFYIRGMEPLKHYWPIQHNSKCTSLKYAVDWGNNNTHKAQAIGEAASRFIQRDMKIEYVYDYMFHLLNEYGKLFKYKPTIPAGAFELCPETMVSLAKGAARDFMEESLVKSPSETSPCNLPPYNPKVVSDSVERKESSFRQVETWEKEYWDNHNIKH